MVDAPTTDTSNGGSMLISMLTVLFIGLKLTGYINWSWWWVLSPVWLPLVLVLAAMALAGVIVWGLEKLS